MDKRTPEEIQRQIDGLKKMKEWLPERSKLGTPNWEALDAQISILNGTKTISDYEEPPDELVEDEIDYVFEAAQDADWWMDGAKNDDLFEEKPD